MQKVNRVLVPIDFSPGSRAALDYAAYVAESFHASLDVLHVWEVPHFVGMDLMLQLPNIESQPIDTFVRSQAEKELADFVAAGHFNEELPVKQRLEAGDVDAVILQIAQDEQYDLIVMGTHGRTGLAHLLMGSVAERVVRQAPCPVMTVREGAPHAVSTSPSAADLAAHN